MIYVSFPSTGADYPRVSKSWSQIAHFVIKALREHYEVKILGFGKKANFKDNDLLITCVPNPNLPHWKRTIIVDNDNFNVDKWKHGKFTKGSFTHKTDHTYKWNNYIKGILAAIIKTNDIAIGRWNEDDIAVLEKKRWLLENVGTVYTVPHPIDKRHFTRYWDPSSSTKPRMLVYSDGWRKYAKPLAEMLRKLKLPHDVVSSIDMSDNNIRRMLLKYTYIGHVSVSEGFPYLANELMCQGLVLYGHEDWWDGQGFQDLRWTYDPETQYANEIRLTKLLTLQPEEMRDLRFDQHHRHMERQDNSWSHLTGILLNEVKKHV